MLDNSQLFYSRFFVLQAHLVQIKPLSPQNLYRRKIATVGKQRLIFLLKLYIIYENYSVFLQYEQIHKIFKQFGFNISLCLIN